MQGKGCMNIGDGKLALGEGVAADFVSGDAVQVGVVHKFSFRVMVCLNSTATTAGGIDTASCLVAVQLLSAHVEHVRHVVTAVGVVVERHLAVVMFGQPCLAGDGVVGDPVTLADRHA